MRQVPIWMNVDDCNLEQTWEDAQSDAECQPVASHCGHGTHVRRRNQIWPKKDGIDQGGNVVAQGRECGGETMVVGGIQEETAECSAGEHNGDCRKYFPTSNRPCYLG